MQPLVAPIAPGTGPARYVEFLRETWRNAARILREPAQQWPAGDSHTISRQVQAECESLHADIAIEYGVVDPFTGRPVDYRRED